MIVQVVQKRTEAERLVDYRSRKGDAYRTANAARMRKSRAEHIPEFIGVDSEGIGKGKNHRAVLIGVGEQQHMARDLRRGLQWAETFEFLYSCYEQKPHAAYVGFYLSYDFNSWLHSLPFEKARLLLTKAGQASRKMVNQGAKRRQFYPVRVDGWEVDTLGMKRLSIRPRVCQCAEQRVKCEHTQKAWMHICDSGPFFQMPFAAVTHPDLWKDDPGGPVCTPQEWQKLFAGKNRRSYAKLDRKMMEYNALENILLARVLTRLATGFARIGIRLAKDEWYGPGSSARKWLQSHKAIKRRDLNDLMPDWFTDACMKSYFGGWFEIFSHGLILGESWNYDINNAYPYATTKLPHLCGECSYSRGTGPYKGHGKYVLVQATVRAKGNRIGPLPYRDSKGNILRPSATRGWYWLGELDAANRAGLVNKSKTVIHEWVEFTPCDHPAPFTEIEDLYYERLRVGKNSAAGLSIKLTNNSLYGKFAQSTGAAPYNNWLYASYITSHCRTQILDAIATHPRRSDAVLMVATDGICFDSPHPTLPISTKLGEWEEKAYHDLCLFKPGVYWHREGKEALLKVKSRGVPKKEFQEGIESVEYMFRVMLDKKSVPGDPVVVNQVLYDSLDLAFEIKSALSWPCFDVHVNFRMKSCKSALNEGVWERAATVQESVPIAQDSDPHSKRTSAYYNSRRNRIDTYIHDLPMEAIQTKYYGEVKRSPTLDDYGYEGPAKFPINHLNKIITKGHHYEMPESDAYDWTEVWNGGPV